MAFWEMVTVAVVGSLIHKARKTAREEREEQELRTNSWQGFHDGISESDFIEIVKNAKKGIKRLKNLSIDGPIVYGVVCTQSGLSEWYFKADFNDYGRLTGTYWLSSDNHDSSIPEHVANIISSSIKNFSPKTQFNNLANSGTDNEDEDDDILAYTHYASSVYRETTQKSFWRRHWKGTFLATLVLVVVAAVAFGVWEYQKLIPMEYDSHELIGVNYEIVIANLRKVGFTNIRTEPTEDLDISGVAEENRVYEIEVLGKSDFTSDTKYPHDIRIVVKYHALKLITPPLSHKEVEGKNYLDIISQFESAGFANIRTEVKYDVIIGWITKDGEVENVTVNGEKKYNAKTEVRPDTEVVITYHTYRSNKT